VRAGSCALFFLLAALPLAAAATIYKSNDFGMQLEPIQTWQRDSLRWVLEVAPRANGEVRRLFRDGKEVRRWEISRAADGRREERDFIDDTLAARRLYSPGGDLMEEDRYTKGKLTQKSLYTYSASRVTRVRVLSADGALLYKKDYFYTSRGSLREVRETGGKEGGETTRDSAFIGGRSGPSEEWNRNGDDLFISRFDDRGRTVETEHHTGKELVSREDFTYQKDSNNLLSSVEKLPAEGKTVARTYDSAGRVQTESVAVGGKVTEETSYTRDDKGRVLRKLQRSANGLAEWRFTLDQDGKTTREEYYLRGALEKVTLYGSDDARTEQLYQGGVLFMKVYYEGGRRTREEVYADGKVVKERKYQ
jgi:antitoxin component YwqK of YwqJK toxin-antitoxin module